MKQLLILTLTLSCNTLFAQHALWQNHHLFENKVSISLPSEMEPTVSKQIHIPHIAVEQAAYKYPGYDNGVLISLNKSISTEQEVKEFYNHILTTHNEQFEILSKEFVLKGDDCYALVECKLKDAYYNNEWHEFGDGSVAPYYGLYYIALQNGIQTSITAHYTFNKELLPDFKDAANKILNSYKLIH